MSEQPEHLILLSHAYLLLDGSGSMVQEEIRTKKPKHRAVAEMVQDLINTLHADDEIVNMTLTIVAYDEARVDHEILSDYDVKRVDAHCVTPSVVGARYTDAVLNQWDPLIGHGGGTPIGRALKYARQKAEQWITEGSRGTLRRAVICLLSDGMNDPPSGPDGAEERSLIAQFEQQSRARGEYKGRIRLATVGYYSHPPGTNEEETNGRELLKRLAFPDARLAYFEGASASDIGRFLHRTMADMARVGRAF